jgi:glycosyltransferase involved in cell wall biosynthesis
VKNAHTIIADNKGIADYVTWRYKKDAKLIAYGGDHALRNVAQEKQNEILSTYGLEKNAYSISVCRIEPENNCHITIDAFAKSSKPLVFVGNWQRNEYSRGLKERYGNCSNIKLIDSIYDLDILYTLRNNARCYIHGHSAGGTNPSLVEAMFLGRPILAYDVVYNRETTYQKAYYWKNSEQLQQLVERNDLTGNNTMLVAQQHYTWAGISKQYEELY